MIKFIYIFLIIFLSVSGLYSQTDDFQIFHGNDDIFDDNIDFNNRGFHHYQDYIDLIGSNDDYQILINSVNGNLYHKRLDFYSEDVGLPIKMQFTYNSGSSFIGYYGNFWQFNYNIRYAHNNLNKHKVVVYPDDKTLLFRYDKIRNFFKPYIHSFDSLKIEDSGNLLFKFVDDNLTSRKKKISADFGNDATHPYVKKLQDEYGNAVRLNYNEEGKLKTMNFQSGKTVILEYDENYLARIILPGGKEISYFYDDFGNMVLVMMPSGKYLAYSYDECGNLIKITSDYSEISIAYDDDFRVSAVMNNYSSLLYKIQYDTNKRTTTLIMPDNKVKYYSYDAFNRSIEYSYENFNLRKLWNDKNLLTGIIDGVGNIRSYKYDDFGRITEIIYPDNSKELFKYSENDNTCTFTNRSGAVAQFNFNKTNQIDKYINSLGKSIEIYRYNNGELSDLILDKDLKVSFLRDNLARIRYVLINNQQHLKIEYNFDDDLNKLVDFYGNNTDFQHDPLGRIISINYPNGSSYGIFHQANLGKAVLINRDASISEFVYDKAGRISQIRKQSNVIIDFNYSYNSLFNMNFNELKYSFDYGINKQIAKIVTPQNRNIDFVYNRNNLVSSINYNSLVHKFNYSGLNLISEYINPNGYSQKYSYNNYDFVNSYTGESGITTLFYYDLNGRITRKTTGGISIYYDYNLDNSVSINYDNIYSKRRTFNFFGDLIEEKIDGVESHHYKYDEIGNLVESTKNNLLSTQFQYDNNYNISNIIFPNAYKIYFKYTPTNKIAEIYDNMNLKTKYLYDELDRISAIITPEELSKKYQWDIFNNLISFQDKSLFNYSFENGDDYFRMKEPNNALTTYRFSDFSNRKEIISVVNDDNVNIRFNYDKVGNLIRSSDDNSNITAIEYNPENTPNSVTNSKGESYSFTYDFLSRIINVRNPENFNKTFAYNSLSQIVRLSDYSGITYNLSYRYDGKILNSHSQDFKIQYTYDEFGNISHYLHYDTDLLSYKFNNGLISEITNKNNESQKFSYDLLGRIKSKTNETGINLNYSYDSAGNLYKIQSSSGSELNLNYSPNSDILSVKLNDLSLAEFSNNNMGSITNISSIDSHKVIQYDNLNNPTRITEFGVHTFQLTNDYLGRVIAIRYFDNRRELFSYDAKGNISQYTSLDGQVHYFTYNYLNHSTKYRWSRIDSIMTIYNPDGQIAEIREPNNTKSYFYWSAGGRLSGLDLFESGKTDLIFLSNPNNKLLRIPIATNDTLDYIFDNSLRYIGINYAAERNIYNESGVNLNNNIFSVDDKKNRFSINYDGNKIITSRINNKNILLNYPAKSLIPNNIIKNNKVLDVLWTGQVKISKLDNKRLNFSNSGNLLLFEIDSNSYNFNYNSLNQLTGLNINQDYNMVINYNNSNNIDNVFDNNNNNFKLFYDNRSNVSSIRKSNNRTFEYLFDNNSNVIITKNELFDESGFRYNNSLPVEAEYPNLSVSSMTYDKWFNTKLIETDNTFKSSLTNENHLFGKKQSYLLYYDKLFSHKVEFIEDKMLKINNITYKNTNILQNDDKEITLPNNQKLVLTKSEDSDISIKFPNGIELEIERMSDRQFTYKFKDMSGKVIENYTLNYDENDNLSSVLKQNSIIYEAIYDFRSRITKFKDDKLSEISVRYFGDNRIAEIKQAQSGYDIAYDGFNRLTKFDKFSLEYDNRGNIISKSIGTDSIKFNYNFENLLTEIIGLNDDTTQLFYSPRKELIGYKIGNDSTFLLPNNSNGRIYPHIVAYCNSNGLLADILDYVEYENYKILYHFDVNNKEFGFRFLTNDNKMLFSVNHSGDISFATNYVNPLGMIDSQAADKVTVFDGMTYIPGLKFFYDGKKFFDPEILAYLQEDNFHKFSLFKVEKSGRENIDTNSFGLIADEILPIHFPFTNRFALLQNEANPYIMIEKELNEQFNHFNNFSLKTVQNYKIPQFDEEHILPIYPNKILFSNNFVSHFSLVPKLPESLLDTILLKQSNRILPELIKTTPKGNEIEVILGYLDYTDIPKHTTIYKVLKIINEIKFPADKIDFNNIYDESPIKPDLELIEKLLQENNYFQSILKGNLSGFKNDYFKPIEKIIKYLPLNNENNNQFNNILNPARNVSQIDDEFLNPSSIIPDEVKITQWAARENISNFLKESLQIKPEEIFPGRALYSKKFIPLPYSNDYFRNISDMNLRKKKLFLNFNKNN